MQGKIDSHFHGNDRMEGGNDRRTRRVRFIEPLQVIKEEDTGEIMV